MDDCQNVNEILEIDFEVGHSSTIRSEVNNSHAPSHTHDWKLYLRSADIKGDLCCLIQRCIFHLQPEYSNCKRELKSTPFAIQETGHDGFHLPIDIYFKTNQEPKMFRIEYYLDLHKNVDGHPYRHKQSYRRKYRCTFYNPTCKLRHKILAAGGRIVDGRRTPSNNTNYDEGNVNEEKMLRNKSATRQSPQQKRPCSPISVPFPISNKKLKAELKGNANNKTQKKNIIKNVNPLKPLSTKKQPKSLCDTLSSLPRGNAPKTEAIKKSIHPISINNFNESASNLHKTPVLAKMTRSHSINDIKSFGQITKRNHDEIIASPFKMKSIDCLKNGLKGTESTTSEEPSISMRKSSLKVRTQYEPTSQVQSTNVSLKYAKSSTLCDQETTSRKVLVPSENDKSTHSSTFSGSLNNNSTRETQSQQPLSSTDKYTLDQEQHSLPIRRANSFNQSHKTIVSKSISTNMKPTKIKSFKSSDLPEVSTLKSSSKDLPCIKGSSSQCESRSNTSTLKPSILVKTFSESHFDPFTSSSVSSSLSTSIGMYQNSIADTPFTEHSCINSENNGIEVVEDIDRQSGDNHIYCQDRLISANHSSVVQSRNTALDHLPRSDDSDSYDSDASMNSDNEVDLPSILTNEDLRCKLIYIYQRFQLNLVSDLIIFVQFFKRHNLIDISSLSGSKKANDVFTYDLFSLSPPLISELANNLGYQDKPIIGSVE